jgi:hypothetical protein
MKVNDIGNQYENIRCWNIKLSVRAVIDIFPTLTEIAFSFFESSESSPKFHHREQVYLFHHVYRSLKSRSFARLLDSLLDP